VEDTKQFYAKIAGAIIAIGIGVAGMTTPPLLTVPAQLQGVLIAGGLAALSINLGGTFAAARLSAAKRRTLIKG
jgi:hypothetical protein